MTALTWPSSLIPASCEIGLQRQVVPHRSQISSQYQSVELGSEFWRLNVTMAAQLQSDAGAVEAFFNQLVGGAQTVTAWHFKRPVPLGTMRDSPTLNAAAAQFSKSLVINTTGTLKAGDMFGVSGQLFQAAADANPVAGVLTVSTVNRVRIPLSSGASVTWYQPTATFVVLETASAFSHTPDAMSPTSYTLVEAP